MQRRHGPSGALYVPLFLITLIGTGGPSSLHAQVLADTSLAKRLREEAIAIWQEPHGLHIIEQLDSVLVLLSADPDEKVRRLADDLRGDQLGLYAAHLADKGRLIDGMRAFQRNLQWFEERGDTAGLAITHNNIGYMLEGLDEARSIAAYKTSLRLVEGSPKSEDLVVSLRLTLASRYLATGHPDTAVHWLEGLPPRLADDGNQAFLHLVRAQIARAKDNLELALEQADSVLLILGHGSDMFNTLQQIYRLDAMTLQSQVFHKQGLHVQAVAVADALVSHFRSFGEQRYICKALRVQAALLDSLQRDGEALSSHRAALDIALQHGYWRDAEPESKVLIRILERAGRFKEALAMMDLHDRALDSLRMMDARSELLFSEFHMQRRTDSLANAQVLMQERLEATNRIERERTRRNALLGIGGGLLLFGAVVYRQRNRISKEKKRSEELLLNILPEEVAEELKTKGEAEARLIDSVTVLFTDFKGFTAMSEVVTPKQLVKDLNECFSAFDRITEKYGIEKIKTIGDAYMAAGGLPTPNTTHATDVISAALEMRDFIAEGKARKVAEGLPYFEIRIGIHTGPVVAGIVGVKKFQYDIWGDTVNTASRMESSGEVGQVNISEATYRAVNGEWELANGGVPHSHSPTPIRHSPAFDFSPRGKVQAKGKGEMEMYFVRRSGEAP